MTTATKTSMEMSKMVSRRTNFTFTSGTVVSLDKGCGNRQRLLARVPLDVAVVKDGKPWTVKVHEENIEVWHEGQRLLWTMDKAHRRGTVGLESVHIPMTFSGVEVR